MAQIRKFASIAVLPELRTATPRRKWNRPQHSGGDHQHFQSNQRPQTDGGKHGEVVGRVQRYSKRALDHSTKSRRIVATP